MIRTTWMWIALTLVAATAGCRMCASCYDYAGPVFGGDCPNGCGSDARAGSIFSGGPAMVQPVVEPTVQPQPGPTVQPQPEPTVQPQLPQYVPSPTHSSSGGGLHPEFGVDPRMIISITDRKADESPETAPQEAPQVVEGPSQPSSQWTSPKPVGQGVRISPSGQ